LEDASFKCTVDQYPISASEGTGGLVGNTPIICGGYSGGYQKSCYSLKEDGSWKDEYNLNTARRVAATGSVIINNKLVIAGGWNGGWLDSIEVVAPSNKSKEIRHILPVPMYGSCIVPWDTNTFMIIGGWVGRNRRETYFFNMANNERTDGPSLLTGRNNFACNTMNVNGEDYIIVAGGNGATRSTEYLPKTNYGSGWQKSVDVPVGLWYHEMVASKGNLYTIGNLGSSNNKDIYKFECTNSITACSWTKIPTQLQYGRYWTVAMPISDALANKLCN